MYQPCPHPYARLQHASAVMQSLCPIFHMINQSQWNIGFLLTYANHSLVIYQHLHRVTIVYPSLYK